jgi:hypothetical protein
MESVIKPAMQLRMSLETVGGRALELPSHLPIGPPKEQPSGHNLPDWRALACSAALIRHFLCG